MKSNLEPLEELNLPDNQGENKSLENEISFSQVERETPQEISAAEKESAYGKILSKVQSQNDDALDPASIASDAQAGSQKMDAESRVQHLIDLAQQKGVIHAVNVAKHMQDNYVLDTMHDRMLADDLHDALVAKGMINEI